MTNLIDLVQIIGPDKEDTPEDIFTSAPGLIFTDDLLISHGTPDSTIVYKSERFGHIRLRTAEPDIEDERKLFSHYLWNAGIKLAELISCDDCTKWNVQDQVVLELGAGVGLCGIVATLAGARRSVISDYPSPVMLDNIRQNAVANLPSALDSRYQVVGHEWGVLHTEFTSSHENVFTRILAADCFWMPQQHTNLVSSMLHFLSFDMSARIFAVAGFHTGRAKLAGFFAEARRQGLDIEEIFEEDAYGLRRPWTEKRDGGVEDHTERKKWQVISILKRPLH